MANFAPKRNATLISGTTYPTLLRFLPLLPGSIRADAVRWRHNQIFWDGYRLPNYLSNGTLLVTTMLWQLCCVCNYDNYAVFFTSIWDLIEYLNRRTGISLALLTKEKRKNRVIYTIRPHVTISNQFNLTKNLRKSI